MTRNERQDLGIDRYVKSNGKGTLNHCTGFGKTHEALKIRDRIIAKWGNITTIIVVPTTALYDQWKEKLGDGFIQVMTIQSLVRGQEEYDCFFLIIDEIHKMAADQFSQVFKLIKYKAVLGLTATYERLDGKQEILDKFCPVVDTVTLEEARRNGWVADFTEYNWGIDFTEEERTEYDEINKQVEGYFAFFNTDYPLVLRCCSTFGAKEFLRTYKPENVTLNQIAEKANICRELYTRRKHLLDNSLAKIDAILEALNYLTMKTVTFGTSTNTADVITDRIGESIAASFHSSIESRTMIVPNKKGIMKPRKVGKDSLLKMILIDFDEDRLLILNTAKKADLGLDVKGLQCAIIYAGTSDPGVHDQRRGRVTRKEGDKEAIILNIYIKKTKDESYLKQRQKNSFRIRWINKITQIEK